MVTKNTACAITGIACKPWVETPQKHEGGLSFGARVEDLIEMELAFPFRSERLSLDQGDMIFVKNPKNQPWAKAVFSINDVQFILVPPNEALFYSNTNHWKSDIEDL